MVQNILSSLDGDEVNSISDTTEAKQVAEIIRTTYFNIVARANLPEHTKLFGLTASGDNDLPVLMYRPDEVANIEWIKYNVSEEIDASTYPEFRYVTILPHDQFLDMVQRFSTDDAAVETFELNNKRYFFKNDTQPTYCTILEDYQIIFDSYNSDVDTTLQESKTLCLGQVIPTFTMSDTFIPDLNDRQFPLLLAEAKSVAFLEMKQMDNPQAVLESRRQWRVAQKSKTLIKPDYLDQLPNFGRPNVRFSRNPFK